MERVNFILDKELFEEKMKRVESIFNVCAMVPNMVFTANYKYFCFEEFDFLMGADAWPILQGYALQKESSSILLGVLEPIPIKYFQDFKQYNWIELPTTLSKDDYSLILNAGPNNWGESIHVNAETVIWLASDSRWAIWGNRSYEVAIFGSHEECPSSWMNIDNILDCMELAFRNFKIPSSFEKEFRKNYSR